jgi:hypothetical protein
MRVLDWAWIGLRWLFGAFFFSTGVVIVLYLVFGIGHTIVQPTAAAQVFDDALHRSGFMDPLIALSYLVGGAALALRRTTPLGLILLAPSVVVIFFFDAVLAHLVPIACAVAGVWGLLALRHFDGFRGLWSYGGPIRVA